jgi:hypothetical protein
MSMKLLDGADIKILFNDIEGKSKKYLMFWSKLDKILLSPNSSQTFPKKINKLEFEQNSGQFWRKTFSNKLEWKIDGVERLLEYEFGRVKLFWFTIFKHLIS